MKRKSILIAIAVIATVIAVGAGVAIYVVTNNAHSAQQAQETTISVQSDSAKSNDKAKTIASAQITQQSVQELNNYYKKNHPTVDVNAKKNDMANDSDNTVDNSSDDDYILPNSSQSTISDSDLEGLSQEQTTLALNEIYARHGRMFNTPYIRDYFNGKSWYHPSIPSEQFTSNMLSHTENVNVATIVKYMKAQGWR